MVEDERRLAEAVCAVLESNKYCVDVAHDGIYGLDCALSNIYDIIILDIMLPGRDGISMLRALREAGIETPVLLLTAKGTTNDKVTGLDSGADDYLTKPFKAAELLARLRALGRRKGDFHNDGLLRYGDIELNPQTLELRHITSAATFHLTLKEAHLLELLLLNHGIAVSATTIIEKLWGFDGDAVDSHVQVYISFLRKKLAQLNTHVHINTIRGVGYTLRTDKDMDALEKDAACSNV